MKQHGKKLKPIISFVPRGVSLPEALHREAVQKVSKMKPENVRNFSMYVQRLISADVAYGILLSDGSTNPRLSLVLDVVDPTKN